MLEREDSPEYREVARALRWASHEAAEAERREEAITEGRIHRAPPSNIHDT